MKKLIGTVALAALLAGSAFAELSMGAWVRTVVVPVGGDGDKIVAGWQNSWGWGVRNARISFNYTSDDEKIGMMYDLFPTDDASVGTGDYCAGWYKPADWVKFMAGKIDNGYTMRSDLCFGSWNWARPGNWFQDDEGLTFNLGNLEGFQIELFPIEGLQIVARLPLWWASSTTEDYDLDLTGVDQDALASGDVSSLSTIKLKKTTTTNDASTYHKAYAEQAYLAYGNGDVAVGYTIGDIGTIKAGFLGEYAESGDAKNYGNVVAAFDLTGIENLFLTVGVKIHVANDDGKKAFTGSYGDFEFLQAALGASYQILDNLKVSASFAVKTYENIDPSMQFGVGVDVGLTDTLGLVADFRGLLPNNDLDPTFSFLVGLMYNFSSNGNMGIGFQGVTNGAGFGGGVVGGHETDLSWAVPVCFSFWF